MTTKPSKPKAKTSAQKTPAKKVPAKKAPAKKAVKLAAKPAAKKVSATVSPALPDASRGAWAKIERSEIKRENWVKRFFKSLSQ